MFKPLSDEKIAEILLSQGDKDRCYVSKDGSKCYTIDVYPLMESLIHDIEENQIPKVKLERMGTGVQKSKAEKLLQRHGVILLCDLQDFACDISEYQLSADEKATAILLANERQKVAEEIFKEYESKCFPELDGWEINDDDWQALKAKYGIKPEGVCNMSEHEFKQGEESICYDCMRDKYYCPDCCDGDIYLSPDSYRED